MGINGFAKPIVGGGKLQKVQADKTREHNRLPLYCLLVCVEKLKQEEY